MSGNSRASKDVRPDTPKRSSREQARAGWVVEARRIRGREGKSSFCESNTPFYDINTYLELMAHGYHWMRFPTFWSKEIGSHRPVIRVCHSILEDQA